MRLLLKLRPEFTPMTIPINYQYYLASAIYHIIGVSSSEYADFLHKNGYVVNNSLKRFKHFTFDRLRPLRYKIDKNKFIIQSNRVDWEISLFVEKALQHFVCGLFEKQDIYIWKEDCKFKIERVNPLPPRNFSNTVSAIATTPISVSVPENISDDKMTPTYLSPLDERFSPAVQMNLVNKYRSLYGCEPDSTDFHIEINKDYLKSIGNVRKLSKLITIKEGSSEETKVRGYIGKYVMSGSIELIKLAYYTGLGERCSIGFGYFKVN